MSKRHLRYWFEWGCGEDFCPCLWDDYGLVSLDSLPISVELKNYLYKLGIEHDNALDWDYPLDPLLWTKGEEDAFYIKAHEAHKRLVEELGEEYEIEYCEDK